MCIWTQPPSFIVYIVDDCFYTTTEELKSCSRNRMAHKVSNSYSLAIYRKNPPTPELDYLLLRVRDHTLYISNSPPIEENTGCTQWQFPVTHSNVTAKLKQA